ncbi:MAG: nucleotidyl transferase AbiEii/AbiGii toxin family protein [Mediterranea sp.]|nr:nucleotidyl transferase AbiEii/AbiGii toxin family protein [Mediterranea sp.]
MLSLPAIEPHTLVLLRGIMDSPLFAGQRLVGGTALALQLGHRRSIDLDLFGKITCDNDELQDGLRQLGTLSVRKESPNIKIYTVNDIKVDFVNYPYEWIDDMVVEDSIRLASPKDIAAMKVNAIQGRGSKKDFVDMYFLLRRFTLPEIMDFYRQKYPDHSVFRAIMSLTYFADADQQASPEMLLAVSWEEMKESIAAEVRKFQ